MTLKDDKLPTDVATDGYMEEGGKVKQSFGAAFKAARRVVSVRFTTERSTERLKNE